MKKIFVLLFAAAVLAVPQAKSQDMFNHMAVGATLGLDGIGVDLVMPMGSNIQLRAGYAIDPIPISTKLDLGSFDVQGSTVNLNNVPLSVNAWKSGNGHLLCDFYPSKKGGFHISAGLFVNNGKLMSASADLSKTLDKSNWGVAIGPEGGFKVSTDENGQLAIDVKTWVVNPYVGIGFGRALNPEKTFNFVFDMGLMVWGSPSVQGYDYSNHIFDSSRPIKEVTIDGNSIKKYNETAAGLLDTLSSIPVCPYIRFGFYFKIF